MRRLLTFLLGVPLAAALAVSASTAAVQGDYLEVRSADVYTGPCFANSQVDLEGNQAILAWKVRQGDWQGVNLAGLSVVAVVKAHATLGDQNHNPYPAISVLIVDQRANDSQRAALEHLARSEAGRLLGHVVRVDVAPIRMEVGSGAEHGSATLTAGTLARVETRSLCAADHLCGNEVVFYPPLVKLAHSMPAYTLAEAFQGTGLGVVWNRADERSAFVGAFSL
jgi:hypothetical protein